MLTRRRAAAFGLPAIALLAAGAGIDLAEPEQPPRPLPEPVRDAAARAALSRADAKRLRRAARFAATLPRP